MKQSIFLVSIFFLVLFACKNKEKQAVDPTIEEETTSSTTEKMVHTLEEIAKLANEGALTSSFSEEDIKKKTITVNEGMDSISSITLFADTKDEVLISFLPNNPSKVWRVTVSKPDCKFYSETGVKLGMTIKELNKLNKKPVDFYGFGWDYGGAVQFNDGALENKNLLVYFQTDKTPEPEFMGDTPHASEDENVKDLNLYVGKIMYESSKQEEL